MTSRRDIKTVQVERIVSSGIQVSLAGHSGIIREREISWSRDAQQDWRHQFKAGDKLDVLELGVGHNQRTEYSLRLATGDPWLTLEDRFAVGDLVDGVVTGLKPYGVFIEIIPGVTGLLHERRFPIWMLEEPPEKLFWVNDHVRVVIEHIDVENRRLTLNMARAWTQRWKPASQQSQPVHEEEEEPTNHAPPLQEAFTLPALKVLVVDDELDQHEAILESLKEAGQSVCVAASAEEALDVCKQESFDFVLMDYDLPGMNGAEALDRIRRGWPKINRILMSLDFWKIQPHAPDAASDPYIGILPKPLVPEQLESKMKELLVARSASTAPQIFGGASVMPAASMDSLLRSHAAVRTLLDRLQQETGASKVVLFMLETAQRQMSIVEESGKPELWRKAVGDLIYSPVRDVAEDYAFIDAGDVSEDDDTFRYLTPLLPFRACLGVRLPARLKEQYCLFLFDERPYYFGDTQPLLVEAVAFALATSLEEQAFQKRIASVQRMALIGQMNSGLVHEINHQLNKLKMVASGITNSHHSLVKYLSNAPDKDKVVGALQDSKDRHKTLASITQRLTETTTLFQQMAVQQRGKKLDVAQTIAEIVRIVEQTAKQANTTITPHVAADLPKLSLPVLQVQQILLNVVINAIQHFQGLKRGSGGHIHIEASLQTRGNQKYVEICVEDDGKGIHYEQWDEIFDLGVTHREEGSGLGLYISRSLIEAMGGRLSIDDSRMLWGTTFVVELPVNEGIRR